MNLTTSLKNIPYLSLISRLAREHKVKVWLVGGYLRDIYLEKDKNLIDFDFCVENNIQDIVRKFAKALSLNYIVLDEEQESLRVIVKKKNVHYQFDFSRIRGASLSEDLLLRDFTMNTLAVDLTQVKRELIDLLGAKRDLDKAIIRASSKEVFSDDPLRILRALSIAALYGFSIEAKTLALIKEHKKLLKQTAAERISEELFKIFLAKNSYEIIRLMDSLEIISEIIPHIDKTKGVSQGNYHHLDVWKHSLETLR